MKRSKSVRDFDFYIDEYMYNCQSRKLRKKTLQAYEQTLRLFERWCMDEMGITSPEEVREATFRRYICDMQERGKYTFFSVKESAIGYTPNKRRDFAHPLSVTSINNYIRNLKAFFTWYAKYTGQPNPVTEAQAVRYCNHKGLITFDRSYKKDSFYAYKAWMNPEPMIHLCGKRYIDRVEDVTRVTVYSNLPEVELFANGVSLGKKSAEDHFFYFDVPNAGETTLEAVAGDLRDEGMIRKVDTMNPDYILREQGAVLNWFDITEIEGRFSLNDKIGDVLKTFRGKLWFAGLFLTLAKKMSANQPKSDGAKKKKKKGKNPEMNSGVINMISDFTILRFTGMLGMRNVTFTKEELLKMNRQLNKIRK